MKPPRRAATPHRLKLGALLHRWHRRLGMMAGLFVLWLAGSGIVLNHSADLGLDHAAVSAPWITGLYGLRAVVPEHGYLAGNHWLAGNAEQTVLDGHLLATPLPGLLGLVAGERLLFAADTGSLAIFDARGLPVDNLHGGDLPLAAIARIGAGAGMVVLADARDQRYASRDGLNWAPYAGPVAWAVRAPLPAAARASAALALRPRLPVERVLLDAHSGHILGHYGPYLVDTVGVLFILLAGSGLWMVIRHRWRSG